jgi:hypothetical protein
MFGATAAGGGLSTASVIRACPGAGLGRILRGRPGCGLGGGGGPASGWPGGAATFRKLADAGVNVDLLLRVGISDELFFAVICVDNVGAASQRRAGRSGRQRLRYPACHSYGRAIGGRPDGHLFDELRAGC